MDKKNIPPLGSALSGWQIGLNAGVLVPKQNCHPDRSVAEWRDLR